MPMQLDSQDSWRIFRIMAEFVEGFEVMAPVGRAVSLFGSARTGPDDPFYLAAERTSALLAKAGFAVITGGGPGIMEAGNKGAFEAGGTSIGLNITLPQEQEANKYQTISLDFHYFYARKVMFVKYASAFICFPGGYGTLDEFFETLTLIQTLKIEAFPIILYGSEYWGGLVEWMQKALLPTFVDAEDVNIFRVVDSSEEAVRLVKQGVKTHWWQPADAELNREGRQRNQPQQESPLRPQGRQYWRGHALRSTPAPSGKGPRNGRTKAATVNHDSHVSIFPCIREPPHATVWPRSCRRNGAGFSWPMARPSASTPPSAAPRLPAAG